MENIFDQNLNHIHWDKTCIAQNKINIMFRMKAGFCDLKSKSKFWTVVFWWHGLGRLNQAADAMGTGDHHTFISTKIII